MSFSSSIQYHPHQKVFASFKKSHTQTANISLFFRIFIYKNFIKFKWVHLLSFFMLSFQFTKKKLCIKRKTFFFPDKIPKLLKRCILKACRQFFTTTTKREIIDVKNRRLSHEHVTRWISFSTFPSKRFFLIFIFWARTKTIGKKRRTKEQTIALINYT